MQIEFAYAASSAAVVAPRNAWSGHDVETGMSATSIHPGMQIAFACTGVVVPVRRNGAADLVREIAQCPGGPEEGVMAFDAFAVAAREAYREYVSVNVTRS
jgi:NAD(P)-dependent dehydrogenase (short-subunit alcohol dehydrogenase family)